jgi:hypothetical protein
MDSVRREGAHARAGRRAAWLAALAAGVAPAALVSPALAQQVPSAPAPVEVAPEPPSPKTPDGVQVFEAVSFRVYNPVTAFDMVSRVPGFEIIDGDDRRGFGATAGNVLINGERPSSKALISDQLKRTPADSVVRVELISGSASNVDVRGQTQLVNVVLKQGGKEASPVTWLAELRDIQYSERLGWTLQATKTFAVAETAELTVDLQAPNLRGRTEGFEAVRNSAGQLTEYRDQFGQPNNIGLQGAATLKWRPSAQDSVNVNALYAPTWNTTSFGSMVYGPNDAFRAATFGFSNYTNNAKAELAADWERRFSPQWSAKVIGLATLATVDQDDVFRSIRPVAGLVNTQNLVRTTESGERVGRGFVTWRPSAAHTVDAGVEGAFNYRDTTLAITNDNGSGPVRQNLPVADTRVEELRGEAFITDVWKMSPALSLETGFIFEASRITQTGDAEQEREFTYPKPRAILTWQADPTNQVRASYVRDVAQLDFVDFASTVAVIDNITTLGNPDLEPEKTWKARLEWERKLGPKAALTLAVFHDAVEDTQDLIPLSACAAPGVSLSACAPADVRTFDAPGNLGDGTRTGIEVRAAAPLNFLGVPNAEVRFSGKYQETEVTDPVTGEDRPFSTESDWTYTASVRQELPKLKSAWGATFKQVSDYSEYKLAEDIFYDRPGDRIDVFVETTQIRGVTLRLSASNIFSLNETRIRSFYQGSRASDVLLRTETRKQKGGPDGTRVISLRVSGTF